MRRNAGGGAGDILATLCNFSVVAVVNIAAGGAEATSGSMQAQALLAGGASTYYRSVLFLNHVDAFLIVVFCLRELL
jgi:hypothetical protein